MNDTKTVSGAIVHVTDADEAPLVRCLVDITPKQSGAGTPSPSNVRAISGWESVNVTDAGKNLLEVIKPTTTINGVTFTVNSDGTVTCNGTATANAYFPFLGSSADKLDIPDGNYYLSGCPSGGSGSTYYITANNGSWKNDYGNGVAITSANKNIASCEIAVKSGTTVNNLIFKPQLELGTTATAYEPYTGTTHTTDLGRTVYGGTLDVVSGVLTVTWVAVEPTASWWSYDSGNGRWSTALNPTPKPTGNNRSAEVIAEAYETNTSVQQGGIGCFRYNTGLYVYSDSSTTPPTGKFCYPLATPQTYTLTGQEVSAMYGENYIWASSGDTTIEYTYLPYGLYGEIRLDGEFLPKPRDFKPGREDVYAGEYTTCTGKTIADKIGWKFSDLDLQWDALKQSDIDKLINLTNACSLRFDDADGLHTEDVIRTSAVSLRNRNTIDGVTWWRDVSAQFKFIDTHNE